MASRLVIDGNSVYEIDEDCENGFGKGAGYGKTASARRNSGRKGRAMEVRGKKESGKTERKRDKLSEYLKDGITETPTQKDGSEGVTTEPNPTRDN